MVRTCLGGGPQVELHALASHSDPFSSFSLRGQDYKVAATAVETAVSRVHGTGPVTVPTNVSKTADRCPQKWIADAPLPCAVPERPVKRRPYGHAYCFKVPTATLAVQRSTSSRLGRQNQASSRTGDETTNKWRPVPCRIFRDFAVVCR